MQRALDDLLRKEELLWRDKAKARWNEQGDSNTHFFHLQTVIHRTHNSITRIQDSHNRWMDTRSDIGHAFVSFFLSLFSSVHPRLPIDLQGLIPPLVLPADNDALVCIPSSSEIQRVVFSMGSYRSPGPDGMSTTFYKQYWCTIGSDVVNAVQMFFSTSIFHVAFNSTFIALIPKHTGACQVEHFRPISLCNVIYKIITKIVAGRLRTILEKNYSP